MISANSRLIALAALLSACGSAGPAPVIKVFAATPEAVKPFGIATLEWEVWDATRVTLDHGRGDVHIKDTVDVTISEPTTYTLTAYNKNHPEGVQRQLTVDLVYPPAQIKAFTANPGQVAPGGNVTLSWTVADAQAVKIDGQAVTGNSLVVTPSKTTTYTLTATGKGKSPAQAALSVTARVAEAPSISSFGASPATITQGQSTTLSWSASSNALSFSLDNGVGPQGLRTTASVHPSVTTTYTLTATSAGGSVTRSAIVTVNPAGGTRTLAYTDPASIPADAVLKLVQDPSSTGSLLVLKLVTTQAASASALAFSMALDGSKAALDSSLLAGDASPGFTVNAAALDPGSPAAARASLRTDGPLANVLTFGISRKPAGGGAQPGDVSLPAGTEIARFRLVIAAGAGPGAVFPLAADGNHPDASDAYKPYRALLRSGTAQSTTLPPSKVALGTLNLN